MSTPKKKVVVVGKETSKKKATPKLQKSAKSKAGSNSEFIFGKKNYLFLGISFLVIALGLLLMAGGGQELSEWNADEIYSFRRITLAPIVILGGFGLAIYAIFVEKD